MKLKNIEWVDGERYKDKFGNIWTVSQKELMCKDNNGKTVYITDGKFALGVLLEMDFEKVEKNNNPLKISQVKDAIRQCFNTCNNNEECLSTEIYIMELVRWARNQRFDELECFI